MVSVFTKIALHTRVMVSESYYITLFKRGYSIAAVGVSYNFSVDFNDFADNFMT